MTKKKQSRLQRWLIEKAASPSAHKILALVAFAESSIFPIPPDILLIPMIVADRTRAFRLAFMCTIASVLGGLVGYCLGYFLIDSVGMFIINTYDLHSQFDNFQQLFREYGFWIIMLKGLTPIPFKLVTIASGASGLGLGKFIAACAVTRAGRFFMLSTAFWYLGEDAKAFYEKHFAWFMILTFSVLIGSVFLLKYLG